MPLGEPCYTLLTSGGVLEKLKCLSSEVGVGLAMEEVGIISGGAVESYPVVFVGWTEGTTMMV